MLRGAVGLSQRPFARLWAVRSSCLRRCLGALSRRTVCCSFSAGGNNEGGSLAGGSSDVPHEPAVGRHKTPIVDRLWRCRSTNVEGSDSDSNSGGSDQEDDLRPRKVSRSKMSVTYAFSTDKELREVDEAALLLAFA